MNAKENPEQYSLAQYKIVWYNSAPRQGVPHECVQPITDIQLRVLKALATQGGEHPLSNVFLDAARLTNTATVRRSLTSLERTGLVYPAPTGWKFASPFFREWMRRRK